MNDVVIRSRGCYVYAAVGGGVGRRKRDDNFRYYERHFRDQTHAIC